MNALSAAGMSGGTLDLAVHGGVSVESRVVEKIVHEVATAMIGVSRDAVDVAVSEWGPGLVIRVAAPIVVQDLNDAVGICTAPGLIPQLRDKQTAMARECSRLTGRDIRRISLTVTGAITKKGRRVR